MGRKLNIAESEFVKEWGMTNQKRGYLVAYDISDDCCRSHVAKILQHYGERLQYSVFLLRVRPSMMLDVRMQIEREIDDSIDSVVFCTQKFTSFLYLQIGKRVLHDNNAWTYQILRRY